jgi:hypothetical protein
MRKFKVSMRTAAHMNVFIKHVVRTHLIPYLCTDHFSAKQLIPHFSAAMYAFAVYYSTKDAKDLDAKKVHLWGCFACSELYFASLGAEKVLIGVLEESAKCEFLILKNRLESNVRNWDGRFLRMSELSKEQYDKILPEIRVSAILQESELQTRRTSASSSSSAQHAPAVQTGENQPQNQPQEPQQVEITPGNPEVPDDSPNASIAKRIISIMGTTPPAAPNTKPAVPCSEVLKAMRPHLSAPASKILANAKRGTPDFPPTFEVLGKKSQWCRTWNLTKVLVLAIPHDELRKCLADLKIVEALSCLMTKTTSNGSPTDANTSIKKLVSDVEKKHQQKEKLLCLVQIPEVVPGAGLLQCRVHIASDGVTALGSVHDFLKWLVVDKDGKHNDWNKWLRHALEKEILHYAQVPSHNLTSQPFLESYQFDGILTPMGNVGVFQVIVRLCIRKSKVASDIVDKAISLWAKRLGALFTRGLAAQVPPKESPDALATKRHLQRIQDMKDEYHSHQLELKRRNEVVQQELQEMRKRHCSRMPL